MLSFFRRALSSWLVLGLLLLLMMAFIVTGVGAPSGLGGDSTGSGDTIVTIGSEKIKASEIERRVQANLAQARRENPALDMAGFLAGGGLESVIQEYVSGRAIELWGRKHGITASDRLIDGDVSSIPAFFGPTGKFDATVMRGVLQQEKISEAQMRRDIAADSIRRQLLIPVAGGARAPTDLVLPYASLLLEQRSAMIGIVPAGAVPQGAPPTDAEVQAFYRANIARFTIPERRALRYAIFGTDQLKGDFAATDAEVQAFYRSNAATYAGSETRSFSQVVLPDQAAANALAAKLRGGTPFAAAAQQAGFSAEDTTIADIAKAALTTRTSAAVANAAFAAAQGALVGPVKSDFGWHVLRVDGIRTVAARPLASVRAEIASQVQKQKRDEALASMVASVQDAIDDGSSFDDVVRSERLTVVTTPALLPNGSAPDQPDFRPAPEVPLLLRNAQQLSADDDPVVETIGAGQRYALLAVSQIVPAAPAPLAKIRDRVAQAVIAKRRADRALAIAREIEAKVKRRVPIARAFSEAGIPLPPPRPEQLRQLDLARAAQQGQEVPRPLALMFAMRVGEVKIAPAPDNSAWFVVSLAGVKPGDAKTVPNLVESTRGEFARYLGDEYAQQFTNAIVREIGVKRDEAAIARLRTRLAGSGQ